MRKQLVFEKAGEYLADVTDMLLSWPGKQVGGTIIMMIRRQQKGYSFADFLWLPEKQGTEVESSGLLHLASKDSAGLGLSSAFRVHSSCLPRALLVRFSSATEGIRGCKGQHDITNSVRQGWGHFQWSFMACQNPHVYWWTALFWGYRTGRDEVTWLTTVHDHEGQGTTGK